MRGGTHALAGVFIGAALALNEPTIEVIAAVVMAGGIGALAPDLDHPRAALSQRIGLFALPFRLVKHRGALHSGVAAGAVMFAAGMVPVAYHLIAAAAALGYASHILLDAMTISGVPLLWPWRRRFRLLALRTGGLLERVIALAMAAALFVMVVGER